MNCESPKGRSWLEPWQWNILLLSTLVKLSLISTYHSTDFEVHRHWLALTNTLPTSQWYFDETSQWTLDYPPFFAYFSYALSIPAKLWDPRIVSLKEGLEYDGWKCILYMRLTVIVTEFVLAGALFALSRQRSYTHIDDRSASVVAASLLLHPGLIIVDHIHFQYNGFLIGILLWSVWAARENRPLLCAFLFSTLLNFKHIFVYIAPAYFFYLLQTYVIKGSALKSYSGAGERLFTLATVTTIPFVLSIAPLALSGLSRDAPAGPISILNQMASRLFPFSRGLNHAYWAANIWALYTFTDRALIKMMPSSVEDIGATASRGVIGDTQFTILPQIAAGHCFLITFAFTLLFSIRLFLQSTKTSFLQAITLFGLTSFLFGFHVHEKAILLPLIPLTLLSILDFFYVRMTLILSISGIVALFPLLYEAKEGPVKYVYTAIWMLVTFRAMFTFHFRPIPSNWDLVMHSLENLYLVGFIPLQLFVSILHPVWFSSGRTAVASLTTKEMSDTSQAAISIVSAVVSQATESISAWSNGNNEELNSTFISAAEKVVSMASSEARLAQDSIATAAESIADMAKDAIATVSGGSNSVTEMAPTMEFLPLMLTSVYCALGVTFVWLRLGHRFLTQDEEAIAAAAATQLSHRKVSSSNNSIKTH